MATISYTFVDRCSAGGHTTFDVSVNGGAAQRATFETDDIRAPLNQLTEEQREEALALILRIHCAGKTRAQLVTEFGAGPVSITI